MYHVPQSCFDTRPPWFTLTEGLFGLSKTYTLWRSTRKTDWMGLLGWASAWQMSIPRVGTRDIERFHLSSALTRRSDWYWTYFKKEKGTRRTDGLKALHHLSWSSVHPCRAWRTLVCEKYPIASQSPDVLYSSLMTVWTYHRSILLIGWVVPQNYLTDWPTWNEKIFYKVLVIWTAHPLRKLTRTYRVVCSIPWPFILDRWRHHHPATNLWKKKAPALDEATKAYVKKK